MFQVRIHGRGGQGVVTTAELLSVAAFAEGRYAQAFPTFGSERTGAPVTGFCRIDDRPIRSHEPVLRPDAVLVQDATLAHQVDLFGGLGPDGYLLINSARSLAELHLDALVTRFDRRRLMTVGATDLAMAHLGRPLPGTALLAAFAALTGQLGLPSVVAAIEERFPDRIAAGNVAAATSAYAMARSQMEEPARASAD
ncbi:pyruvate ferredoxin oxidoreductase gamma subunit [Kribbella amoyensis]|uniref:Pyruvate ferredoxin oxidoreductase gamma subunit n=1 Tax=Kribbella amoyensis TaxID=996641 RepID=A0A561C0A9_9ACTN|nr:2-oxoacid:acceptor oxidoreductase family protein [Kribbella amoyensis]TWD84585.1 pyruvate ferredoxin oxidoreductase gamma subunit [Kribbella amoyensis]